MRLETACPAVSPRRVAASSAARWGGGPFLVVPAHLQEGHHGPGQLPGVAVEPGPGGEGDGGEQDVVLGLEPGQGLLVIGGPLGSGAGPGRREGGRLA
jgi:hypothetical protein